MHNVVTITDELSPDTSIISEIELVNFGIEILLLPKYA
jgi:hypothetical protein